MQLAENTVVAGRFRLNRLIGRGGMGSVWQATHLGLDIPCAVKFIEGELATLEEAKTRFEREAKAAAQLRSPHVVQILDHGICEDTPYIAMELLDGEDLGKRLAKVGHLTPAELHGIMSQVCRALTKAHALGVVHRDLKPDNIFLVKDDDREIAKVLDFGIAKSRMHDLNGSSNTKTGAMLGTPYYMSPEQAQGTRQVDFRTDLWALAVICFQALTGRLPFESGALGDLLVKIIMAPLPMPSQFGAVPPDFDRWWEKAASRDVTQRFQSAKDFSDSLALVCGVSQVSGTLDRAKLTAGQAGSIPRLVAASPYGHEPMEANYAPANTQGGSALGAHGLLGAPGTGAPMTNTVGGAAPGSRTGLIVILAAAAVVVLGSIGGGVALWKTRVSAAASPAAAPPSSEAAPLAPPSVAPVVAPVATAVVAEGNAAPTGATNGQDGPSVNPPSRGPEPQPITKGSSRPGKHNAPQPPPSPATPSSPGKPAKADMGF
jgi:hypothetical protein